VGGGPAPRRAGPGYQSSGNIVPAIARGRWRALVQGRPWRQPWRGIPGWKSELKHMGQSDHLLEAGDHVPGYCRAGRRSQGMHTRRSGGAVEASRPAREYRGSRHVFYLLSASFLLNSGFDSPLGKWQEADVRLAVKFNASANRGVCCRRALAYLRRPRPAHPAGVLPA
jgi:hypothetical protein